MQKLVQYILLSSIVLLGSALAPTACAQTKTYEFRSWDVDIEVFSDSSIVVNETQAIDLRGAFTWVSRALPKTKGILFDDIRVFDAAGVQLGSDSVEIADRRDEVWIKVVFPETPEGQVSQKVFTFQYRAYNALGDFQDHDELYWNAVSSDRSVPIRYASVTVTLPQPYTDDEVQQRLFVGPVGSTSERSTYEISDERTLNYSTTDILANEQMTIVAGWPKGAITFQTVAEERGVWQSIWAWLKWVYFFSPALLFVWLFRRWKKHGRDPEGKKTIIPQYDPPDGAPPAVVGTLVDERADNNDFSATIIDLAVRGYLKIEEDEDGGWFKKKKYTFIRTKKFTHDLGLKLYEQSLLSKLFATGDRVALDQLKNKFHTHLREVTGEMYKVATDEYSYFPVRPDNVRKRYYYLALAMLPLGFFLYFVPWIYGVLLLVFGRVMPKKTAKGTTAFEWAEGFKLYLHTAERFRVAAMTPETFERFLPYAMVFGVEKQWANRFSDIYTEPPRWFYSTHPMTAFSAVAFTEHLSSVMHSAVVGSLASSPSSSSGFGGGGFSGGGGGGGGSGAG